jgi:hypothetical protein
LSLLARLEVDVPNWSDDILDSKSLMMLERLVADMATNQYRTYILQNRLPIQEE